MFVLNFVWRARRKEKDAAAPSQEEPKLYLEPAVMECTVPESRLREIVHIPAGLDYNEWLASHTIALFDHSNLIYGTISEYCTMSGCPDMTGPSYRQYLWFDEKGKKCKVAAPQYIDYVMTFTQKTVNDESIFPTKFDKDFPSSFESIVKKIHRLLFHVLAHMYHGHFREIVLLNLHAHLNCLFSHFTIFNECFKLVEEKETEVLRDLALALKLLPGAEKTDRSPVADYPPPTEEDGLHNRTGSPPLLVPQSPSIASSITALHSRTSSGGHSNSNSCAMDSAMMFGTSATALSPSSPIKFQ